MITLFSKNFKSYIMKFTSLNPFVADQIHWYGQVKHNFTIKDAYKIIIHNRIRIFFLIKSEKLPSMKDIKFCSKNFYYCLYNKNSFANGTFFENLLTN